MHYSHTIAVDDSPMELLIAQPRGGGPFPSLLVGMHNPAHAGLAADEFSIHTAERFAAEGYISVTPNPYHRWPSDEPIVEKQEKLDDGQIITDLTAGLAHLSAMQNVDSSRLGITGYCFGGMLSWLGAVHNPTLKACAIFWGGGINVGRPEGSQPPIKLADRMPCPIIGFFGNDDSRPSPTDVDEYAAALEAAGKPYAFHRYDGAGHAFQNFTSEERYRKAASDDAWEKVLAFFAQHLGEVSASRSK
jgi:carboxymethylenebutenolidase